MQKELLRIATFNFQEARDAIAVAVHTGSKAETVPDWHMVLLSLVYASAHMQKAIALREAAERFDNGNETRNDN